MPESTAKSGSAHSVLDEKVIYARFHKSRGYFRTIPIICAVQTLFLILLGISVSIILLPSSPNPASLAIVVFVEILETVVAFWIIGALAAI